MVWSENQRLSKKNPPAAAWRTTAGQRSPGFDRASWRRMRASIRTAKESASETRGKDDRNVVIMGGIYGALRGLVGQ